jgi:hypothetical protein
MLAYTKCPASVRARAAREPNPLEAPVTTMTCFTGILLMILVLMGRKLRDQAVETCPGVTKVAVDVKTEGGLLTVYDRPGVKWFLLSILSLKPS